MHPDNSESTPLLAVPGTSAISRSIDTDDDTGSLPEHSLTRLASSYHRPSFVTGGGRGLVLSASPIPESALRDDEAFDCVREERELLEENSIVIHVGRRVSVTADAVAEVEETWDEAVKGRKIKTSWKYELKVIARYSAPLVITFLLQQSLSLASVLSLGHLGTTQLGGNSYTTDLIVASALATMTASITGSAIFQGIATALDTLCSQAWGSGNPQLVGLHLQRCLLLLLLCHIPVGIIWGFSEHILLALNQEPELARLASQYLHILFYGMPAYAIFEATKRFLQAQGIFGAATFVLFIVAPINAILNYALVWETSLRYYGAPMAVAISYWIMASLLILYIIFIDGKQAWGGFSSKAFQNWGPLCNFAISGVVMICSEWAAFEVLALAASYIGTVDLAANSILNTSVTTTYQIPFAISVAVSTRVGNLLGATLDDAARTAANVGVLISASIGILNGLVLYVARRRWGYLFNNDPEVVTLVGEVMPYCAIFQIFDALSCVEGGILRGQGRQHLGGMANVIVYWLIALPVGLALTFKADWELYGLWAGMVFLIISMGLYELIALGLCALVLGVGVQRSDWKGLVEKAMKRDEAV